MSVTPGSTFIQPIRASKNVYACPCKKVVVYNLPVGATDGADDVSNIIVINLLLFLLWCTVVLRLVCGSHLDSNV